MLEERLPMAKLDARNIQVMAPDLQSKAMDLDSGWLGRCFGSTQNAPGNIAGLVVVLLLVLGIYVTAVETKAMQAPEYWKTVLPVITLVLGYLFGRKNK